MHGSEYAKIYKKDKNHLDFSVNTNPFACFIDKGLVTDKIFDSISKYPYLQYKNIKSFFYRNFGINKENILPLNGVSEGFYLIFSTLRPKKTLIACPCYSDYIKNAELFSKSVKKACYDDIFNEKIDISLYDVLIFGSPNNPDSKTVNKDKIIQLTKKNKKTLFIIDQSFIEFCLEDRLSLLNTFSENLIVLYSFTKFYSIPGLRLGAIISEKKNVRYFKRYINDWNVNSICEEFVLLLDDEEKKEKSLININIQKDYIYRILKDIKKIEINYPSANFFLLEVEKNTGDDFFDFMLENKIILRRCDDYYLLGNDFFRFCIKKETENKKICEKIIEYYK